MKRRLALITSMLLVVSSPLLSLNLKRESVFIKNISKLGSVAYATSTQLNTQGWEASHFIYDDTDPTIVIALSEDGKQKLISSNGILVIPSTNLNGDAITKVGNEYNSQNVDFLFETIKELIISEGIKEIENNAFGSVKIEKLTLPQSLEKIGDNAFNNSHLAELSLPKNVTSIGRNAFSQESIDGHIPIHEIHKRRVIKNIIFEGGDENKLEIIEEHAFADIGITSITFPKNLKTIRRYAFVNNVDLENIVFSGPIENIEEYGFALQDFHSDNPTNIVLGEGLEVLESNVFGFKKIQNFKFPKSIKKVKNVAFDESIIRTLEISHNLTDIESSAFSMYVYDGNSNGGWKYDKGEDAYNNTDTRVALYRVDDSNEYVVDNTMQDETTYIVNPVIVKFDFVDKDGNPIAVPDEIKNAKLKLQGVNRSNENIAIDTTQGDYFSFKLGDTVSFADGELAKKYEFVLADSSAKSEFSLQAKRYVKGDTIPATDLVKDIYYTDANGNDLGYDVAYKKAEIKIREKIQNIPNGGTVNPDTGGTTSNTTPEQPSVPSNPTTQPTQPENSQPQQPQDTTTQPIQPTTPANEGSSGGDTISQPTQPVTPTVAPELPNIQNNTSQAPEQTTSQSVISTTPTTEGSTNTVTITEIPNVNPPKNIPFVPNGITNTNLIPDTMNEPVFTIINSENVTLGNAIINEEQGTYTFIDDDITPLGIAKINGNNTLEIVEIFEDEVPLSLPKTGEKDSMLSFLGAMLIAFGVIARRNKK